MTAMEGTIPADRLTIVPANEASWDDVAAIFGTADPGRCQCQRFKVVGWTWRDSTQEERTAMLRDQTACGDPDAAATSGLVAYVDKDPAGWVAVEPRTAYPKPHVEQEVTRLHQLSSRADLRRDAMTSHPPLISVMLAVPDATAAAQWYARALGATELWDLGGVMGLAIEGTPFFLGEPEGNRWDTPATAGTRTVRIEVFVDDPDAFLERAVAAGADAGVDPIRDHAMPWGVHRQGGFLDPFGHLWLVGDRSPLAAHP